jgi:hypothetical protein
MTEIIHKIDYCDSFSISTGTLVQQDILKSIIDWIVRNVDDSNTGKACQEVLIKIFEEYSGDNYVGNFLDNAQYHRWVSGDYKCVDFILILNLCLHWSKLPYDEKHSEEREWYNDFYCKVFDLMNEIAHDGLYFGAHWGDGSDIGFHLCDKENEEEMSEFLSCEYLHNCGNHDVCPKCGKKLKSKLDETIFDDDSLSSFKNPISEEEMKFVKNMDDPAIHAGVEKSKLDKKIIPQNGLTNGDIILSVIGTQDIWSSNQCSDEYILDILNRNNNYMGGFLSSFTECFIKADGGNRTLLRPVARALIQKYEIK